MNAGGWVGKQGFGFSLRVLPLPLQVKRDTRRDRGGAVEGHAGVNACVFAGVPVHTLIRAVNREKSAE